jgi:hypothetical protein
MAITAFTYSLPNDVDYIRADTSSYSPGETQETNKKSGNSSPSEQRSSAANLPNKNAGPNFKTSQIRPTYVPTKIALSISAIPVISRYESSNNFSLRDYASGKLLQGSKGPYGGFW